MSVSLATITSMLESAKEFTMEAAASASSRLVEVPLEKRLDEIYKLLSSRVDSDVLIGMRCVILAISRGEDGLKYFADVVKNITTSDSKVKRLVMIYLVRFAEQEPDTALLSINSIQKSLNDKQPDHRARAIRALAGIHIAEIVPILLLCLKRTVGDPSPLVRGATAIALVGVYDIDSTTKKQVSEYLAKLLLDASPVVVGSALKLFYKLNQKWRLVKAWAPIHGNYRRYCAMLGQLDEWAQSFAIDVLTEYARRFIARPQLTFADGSLMALVEWESIPSVPYEVTFDDDLELLLRQFRPLLKLRLEVVLLSIARLVLALTPPLTFADSNLAESLISVRTPVIYGLIAHIARLCPFFFSAHYKKFFVHPTDDLNLSKCKVDILASVANEDNAKYIVEELKYYALHLRNIAPAAIKALGSCALLSPNWQGYIFQWCLGQIKAARSGFAMNELLTVVRRMLQQSQDAATVYKLAVILRDHSASLNGDARASIIWMIGEFTLVTENKIGPDVLRTHIAEFSRQPQDVRYQLLVLGAKAYTYELVNERGIESEHTQHHVNLQNSETGNLQNAGHGTENCNGDDSLHESTLAKMFKYVLQLAKYDESYDIRDRARLFDVLLNGDAARTELASLFLEVPKPAPIADDTKNGVTFLDAVLNLCPWGDPLKHPDASVRKATEIKVSELSIQSLSRFSRLSSPVPLSSHAISHKTVDRPKQEFRLQSLDDFFGSEESESDSESDDSESDEEGENIEGDNTNESEDHEEESEEEEESEGEESEEESEDD